MLFMNLLHGSDPVKVELNRLENEVRDKDKELLEAQAEIKALRHSERLREKAVEKYVPHAEDSVLGIVVDSRSDATSPQTGGSMKSMKKEKDKEKDKSSQAEKEGQEGSGLKTAGPEGEITAGFLIKKSAKTNGWSKRWFVLNGKTGKVGTWLCICL